MRAAIEQRAVTVRRGTSLLHLADRTLLDAPGGAQTVAWALAKGLVGKGHTVTILTPSWEPGKAAAETVGGVCLARHRGAGSFSGMMYWGRQAARDLIASQGVPGLVHSHFAYAEMGPQ